MGGLYGVVGGLYGVVRLVVVGGVLISTKGIFGCG